MASVLLITLSWLNQIIGATQMPNWKKQTAAGDSLERFWNKDKRSRVEFDYFSVFYKPSAQEFSPTSICALRIAFHVYDQEKAKQKNLIPVYVDIILSKQHQETLSKLKANKAINKYNPRIFSDGSISMESIENRHDLLLLFALLKEIEPTIDNEVIDELNRELCTAQEMNLLKWNREVGQIAVRAIQRTEFLPYVRSFERASYSYYVNNHTLSNIDKIEMLAYEDDLITFKVSVNDKSIVEKIRSACKKAGIMYSINIDAMDICAKGLKGDYLALSPFIEIIDNIEPLNAIKNEIKIFTGLDKPLAFILTNRWDKSGDFNKTFHSGANLIRTCEYTKPCDTAIITSIQLFGYRTGSIGLRVKSRDIQMDKKIKSSCVAAGISQDNFRLSANSPVFIQTKDLGHLAEFIRIIDSIQPLGHVKAEIQTIVGLSPDLRFVISADALKRKTAESAVVVRSARSLVLHGMRRFEDHDFVVVSRPPSPIEEDFYFVEDDGVLQANRRNF